MKGAKLLRDACDEAISAGHAKRVICMVVFSVTARGEITSAAWTTTEVAGDDDKPIMGKLK